MSKKSILAETLAEIQDIKKGIEENANHILKSTLKEDLEAIVRKGLNEAEDDMEDEMGGDEEPSDLDGEFAGAEDLATSDSEMGDMDDMDDMDDMEDEMGGDEVIDLTDEPDEKVLDAFERMQLTDEIEIVKTPEGGVQINIEPKDGEETEDEDEMDTDMDTDMDDTVSADELDSELSDEEGEEEEGEEGEVEGEEEDDETLDENDDVIYEIEIDEEEEMTPEHEEPVAHVGAKTGMSGNNASGHNHEVNEMEDSEGKEKELRESLVKTRKKMLALVVENKNKEKELNKVKRLIESYKKNEKEYKTSIGNLKVQLKEVALFTSNLTYAVKLISENSTTKDEKLDILKKFDSAKTLSESKQIFNSLNSMLNSNKSGVEKAINNKVLDAPKSSGATLNESTAYKNPQLERMLEIIGKIK